MHSRDIKRSYFTYRPRQIGQEGNEDYILKGDSAEFRFIKKQCHDLMMFFLDRKVRKMVIYFMSEEKRIRQVQ
jgi:hypothetical protein